MTINVRGYAAPTAKTALAPYQFTRRDIRSDDVVIKILYCGICHSDLHSVNNDWGWSMFPIVPGHEIIGQVESVGPAVTRFKPVIMLVLVAWLIHAINVRLALMGWNSIAESAPRLSMIA